MIAEIITGAEPTAIHERSERLYRAGRFRFAPKGKTSRRARVDTRGRLRFVNRCSWTKDALLRVVGHRRSAFWLRLSAFLSNWC